MHQITNGSVEDRANFMAWALKHGGLTLTLALDKASPGAVPRTEYQLSPALFYYTTTEMAWRAWASKTPLPNYTEAVSTAPVRTSKVSKLRALVEEMQRTMSRYLEPNKAGMKETLDKLIILLDGPEQRVAFAEDDQAMDKAKAVPKEVDGIPHVAISDPTPPPAPSLWWIATEKTGEGRFTYSQKEMEFFKKAGFFVEAFAKVSA